tara:strand:+ start:1470 stop:2492 length:1023 start_codon:yes stop_codon:yes gene_type:complete
MVSGYNSSLGWLEIKGNHFEIGRQLGIAGRKAVHRYLIGSPVWNEVLQPKFTPQIDAMMGQTRLQFPHIWDEISGLADGLGLPVEQVAAWNCRGDLLMSVPDGCTTVQIPGSEPTIGHNEDGLPFFRGSCFIADVKPENASGFISFYYPGSIPGHTFAITKTGLVQTVNNLRLLNISPQIPRMVLGRAILDMPDIDAALSLLQTALPSGGFHFTLAQGGSDRIASVEFGTGECVLRDLTKPSVHANHALNDQKGYTDQIITQSSGDRQSHGSHLIASGIINPLEILRDKTGSGLPIYRDQPDDPDCENTLATLVVNVGQDTIEWQIFDRISKTPAYQSTN